MKKLFLLLIASILMALTASASPTGTKMGDQLDIPIRKKEKPVDKNRPHAPSRSVFSAFLDTDSSLLFIYPSKDVGEVSAVIENIEMGINYQFVFDSTEIVVLPIDCVDGEWYITLTLSGGAEYVGQFNL